MIRFPKPLQEDSGYFLLGKEYAYSLNFYSSAITIINFKIFQISPKISTNDQVDPSDEELIIH